MSRRNNHFPVEGAGGPLLEEETLQLLGSLGIGGPGRKKQLEPASAPERSPLITLQPHSGSNSPQLYLLKTRAPTRLPTREIPQCSCYQTRLLLSWHS